MKKLRLLFIPLIVIPFLCNCATVKYKVIFDSNGGTSVPTQEVVKNKCAKEPDKPTKTPEIDITYTFDAWHKVVDGQMEKEPFDFVNTPIVEETTLKATWTSSTRLYTVSFDTGEGGCVVEPQKVPYKGYATPPEGDITRKPTAQYKFEFSGEWLFNGSVFEFTSMQITDNITLEAKWNKIIQVYTVDFDADGGSPQPAPIENIEYGKTVVEAGYEPPTEPTRDSSQYYDYTFGGWQMEDGQLFDFSETKIQGPTHLKAKWISTARKYTVYFNSDGGSDVDPIANVEAGKPVGESKKPNNPTKEDFVWKYKFENWYRVKDGVVSKKPFSFKEDIVDGNIMLQAKWTEDTKQKYSLTAENGDHLEFGLESSNSFNGIDTTVNAYDEFTFKMSLGLSSNPTPAYKLPTSLNIKVGNRILRKGYTIDSHGSTAFVTIEKDVIDGAVVITGSAIEINYFSLDIDIYGATSDATPFNQCDLDCIINLETIDEYGTIDFGGIWVKFDNENKYVNPLNDQRVNYEDMDFAPKIRIIGGNVSDHISIVVLANKFPLLEKIDWSVLDEYSRDDLADKLFKIGDVKTFDFDHSNCQIRIIGFNHDYTDPERPDDTKLGITFEFTNVVKKNITEPYLYYFNECSPDVKSGYSNSTYEQYLNSTLYIKAPPELRRCIKFVSKPCYNCTSGQIENIIEKVFALSLTELNGTHDYYKTAEGAPYAYYMDEIEPSIQERRKKGALSTEPVEYWTRSPTNIKPILTIDKNGNVHTGGQNLFKYGYMAAFCI